MKKTLLQLFEKYEDAIHELHNVHASDCDYEERYTRTTQARLALVTRLKEIDAENDRRKELLEDDKESGAFE